MSAHLPIAPIVSIRPYDKVTANAVAKSGNLFWLRPGGVPGFSYLIPVVEGVPHVEDFIIARSDCIIQQADAVGYGQAIPPQPQARG